MTLFAPPEPVAPPAPVPGSLRFTVHGLAETQGSKTPISRGGKTWLVEGSPKKARRHQTWREAVADAARDAQQGQGLIDGPVVVHLAFYLMRPASAPKRRRTWPVKARSGDVDKLARSVLDSLTGTIIGDDSQCVGLLVTKDWGDPPRVVVGLERAPEDADGLTLGWLWGRPL